MRKIEKCYGIRIFLVLFLVVGICAAWNVNREEKQEVSTSKMTEDMVILGGVPIGIYMETDGVLVLGTESMESVDGLSYEPAEYAVQEGDYILALNHEEIESKKELVETVKKLDSKEVILTIRRQSEEVDVKIKPVEVTAGEYKLGIWVRDNIQGLGTLTYLTSKSTFGALGHGIHDADTDVLLDIKEGKVYKTSVRGVQKGKAGTPGGLEGLIVYNNANILGSITQNSETGIYGSIDNINSLFTDLTPVKLQKKEKIKTGKASILCTIDGERKTYEIEILRIDLYNRNINKGIALKVTDKELLEKTGGIVQGMSGSPIIQDGKLIGAVTHVLVNDPTTGYGIFIENMLEH